MSFLPRVLQYAEETGIRFKKVPRLSHWQKYGLPDLRGFTPHLRTINYCDDQNPLATFSKIKKDSGDLPDFWFIHDLLHIVFYDFASMNLGDESWNDKDRFIESHLASEAYAVLALDYHFLIKTKFKGLAVDVSRKEWGSFQRLYAKLPDSDSFDFCRMLTDFYLSGRGELRRILKNGGTEASSQNDVIQKKFDQWLGHEVRYADKQRHYVLAWFEDLSNKSHSGKSVSVKESFVSEPLWELLGYFHWADEDQWKTFLGEMKKFIKKRRHYFSKLPKYAHRPTQLDFRYTDILGLKKSDIAKALEQVRGPNPSSLFLFWQLLSLTHPSLHSGDKRHAAQVLARTSQTPKVDAAAWKTVLSMANEALDKVGWKAESETLATFFLP